MIYTQAEFDHMKELQKNKEEFATATAATATSAAKVSKMEIHMMH